MRIIRASCTAYAWDISWVAIADRGHDYNGVPRSRAMHQRRPSDPPHSERCSLVVHR